MNEISLWSGRPLADLWPILAAEAQGAAGAWVGRRFRSGAVVFLRDAGGKRTLRIARGARPKTDAGSANFLRECGVFLREFGLVGWVMEEEPNAPGIALRYHEPAGRRCVDCGHPLQPNDLLYGDGEHCTDCVSELPCRRGCGRMASVRKGTLNGICPVCSEEARLRMGWAPTSPPSHLEATHV